MQRWTYFHGKIAAQISQFIVPGPNFLRQAPCLTSQSRTSPPTWTVTRCSTSFGGWTIASVRVLALVQLEIHSLEEKLWTFASTAGARWQMWATPFAPTSAFACASRTSALCPQPKDLQSAFASTKSLRVVMDGVASNSLTGLPALVTPSGSTTSSAWVWAFLPRKPMAVLCLLSRWRSCASRAEQSWPRLWREANCAPWWALACASGSSVLCHQQRELLCSCASTFSTRKGPQQSRLHMDLEIHACTWMLPTFLMNVGFPLYFSPSLAAPQFWRWCGWSSLNVQFACFPPKQRNRRCSTPALLQSVTVTLAKNSWNKRNQEYQETHTQSHYNILKHCEFMQNQNIGSRPQCVMEVYGLLDMALHR